MKSKKVQSEKSGLLMRDPEKVPLSELSFAEYNPRIMPDDEMVALKASMVEHGVVLNLVVQRKADDGTPMVLIGGHQRVRAARELCEERGWPEPSHAWAVVLDVDDCTAKRLNVSLNKISGLFDDFKLGEMFAGMPDLTDAEVLAVGFTREEMEQLSAVVADPLEQADALEGSVTDLSSLPQIPTLSVVFGSAEDRDSAKEALRRLLKMGIAPGKAVLLALQQFEVAEEEKRDVESTE